MSAGEGVWRPSVRRPLGVWGARPSPPAQLCPQIIPALQCLSLPPPLGYF